MKINVNMDAFQLVNLTDQMAKRLPDSVIRGINATAVMIQNTEIANVDSKFTMRSPTKKSFLEKQIAVIKPFASFRTGTLFAEIAIGQKPRLMLSGFESGANRPPAKGTLIAQPVVGSAARMNWQAEVPSQLTFQKMKLKAIQTHSGKTVYKGSNSTFTIKGVGVFMRVGKEAKDIQLLYHFAKKQVLPAKLGWEDRAKKVADKWLTENITQNMMKSLPSQSQLRAMAPGSFL